MFQKSNSFRLQGDNNVNLNFIDFTGFCPLVLNEELKEKLNVFISIQNLNNDLIKSDPNLIELTKNYLLNFDLFEKEKNLILKVKLSHLYEFFKIMEKTLEEAFNGEKILIDEEDYCKFFEVALQEIDCKFEPRDIFMFERHLNYVMNIIIILIENSILNYYSQLFIGKKGSFQDKRTLFYDDMFDFSDQNTVYKPVITRVKLSNMEISLKNLQNAEKFKMSNPSIQNQKPFLFVEKHSELSIEEQVLDEDDLLLDKMWKAFQQEKQIKERRASSNKIEYKNFNENQVNYEKTKTKFYDTSLGEIMNDNNLLFHLGVKLNL
jgi:hypothetical protein